MGRGRQIKQINNIRIYENGEGFYRAVSPKEGVEESERDIDLYVSPDLRQVINYCEQNREYLNRGKGKTDDGKSGIEDNSIIGYIHRCLSAFNDNSKEYDILSINKLGGANQIIIESKVSKTQMVVPLSWIEENRGKVDGYIGETEGKPLVKVKLVPYWDTSERCNNIKSAYYLGGEIVQPKVSIKVRDENPSLRYYSNSRVSLSGKTVDGTIQSISFTAERIKTREEIAPSYSDLTVEIEYTGNIPHNYENHALTREVYKDIAIDERGNIEVKNAVVREFNRYRSGCGYAEYYVQPEGSYKKVIKSFASVCLSEGSPISIHYLAEEDPEFVLQQKMKRCETVVRLHSAIEIGDSGGYETISEVTLHLNRCRNQFTVGVKYIADEYRRSSKALEYEGYTSPEYLYELCERDDRNREEIDRAMKVLREKAEREGIEIGCS